MDGRYIRILFGVRYVVFNRWVLMLLLSWPLVLCVAPYPLVPFPEHTSWIEIELASGRLTYLTIRMPFTFRLFFLILSGK